MNMLRGVIHSFKSREERKIVRLRRVVADRLRQLVSSRATIILDRLGLADLSDLGFTRQQVFEAMQELMVRNLVVVQASVSGHVILCSHAAAEQSEAGTEPPAAARKSRGRSLSSRPRERRHPVPNS